MDCIGTLRFISLINIWINFIERMKIGFIKLDNNLRDKNLININ